MSVSELLQSVQSVVDTGGVKKAVLVDFEVWEEVVTLLEDLEDAEEIQQARQEDDELIPWEGCISSLWQDASFIWPGIRR